MSLKENPAQTYTFTPRDATALEPLWAWLRDQGADEATLARISARAAAALDLSVDSRLTDWRAAIEELSALPFTEGDAVRLEGEVRLCGRWGDRALATETLQRLHPWRKGPLHLGDVTIDTEWRSDWKWTRVSPHITLEGARVLDIGCGNGYHCWRALGDGAAVALGVDPTRLFHYQHRAAQTLLSRACQDELPAYHLPLTLEALDDAPLPYFDLILSMGVLYHRRDPQAHLRALQLHFAPEGGELLLETLITPSDEPLYPTGRYAQMRNVWCLPDQATLLRWLSEAGYRDVELVDLNQTSLEEQRQTEWMRFYSLRQALDPQDLNRTIEGHPAPLRAAVRARYLPQEVESPAEVTSRY